MENIHPLNFFQADLAWRIPGTGQTHVHQVSDATQPSHPLSLPSPPALNLSQRQGLFQSQLFT